MKRKYAQVRPETIDDLAAILGKDGISTKKSDLENYASDEMPFLLIALLYPDCSPMPTRTGFRSLRAAPVPG